MKIKDLKKHIENGSLIDAGNGEYLQVQRSANNVIRLRGSLISWADLQDLLSNGTYKLVGFNKTTWGGVRPGAGRPKKRIKKKPVSFTLDKKTIELLDHLAGDLQKSRSSMITEIIQFYSDNRLF